MDNIAEPLSQANAGNTENEDVKQETSEQVECGQKMETEQEKIEQKETVTQTDDRTPEDLQVSAAGLTSTEAGPGQPITGNMLDASDKPPVADGTEGETKTEMGNGGEGSKPDVTEAGPGIQMELDENRVTEQGGEEIEGGEGDDGGDPDDENRSQMPLSERRKKKRMEVFVGGLDKEATEEDLREVFGKIGEVAEVRLMKEHDTGKNKGFAFVRYNTAACAARAAKQLKSTQVRGKKVGVVPSEENDTLFVGNINKSWTKDEVSKALNDLGIVGIEEMTLMEDPQNEGLNRGFAFLEFSSHKEALSAWRKLQTPEIILGSTERSAKVAWAQPLNEPDEETMAQVKSVFVDGMPSTWTQEQVKAHFEKFGAIERIVLARNIPAAKRKDFGFVNYKSREAAVAAIEALHNKDITHEGTEVRVKVTLAKPPNKTRPVKGSVRGNYLISRVPRGGDGGSKSDGHRGGRGGSRNERRDGRDRGKGRRTVVDEKSSIDSLLQVLREQAETEMDGAERATTNGDAAKQETSTAADSSAQAKSEKPKEISSSGTDKKPGSGEGDTSAAEKRLEQSEPKSSRKYTEGFVNDKYECVMCCFGTDIEAEYERHMTTKVHQLIADLRKDEKLSNKTPLSVLHEFATRNRAEVAYETQSESNIGPFEITAKIRGSANGIPGASGVGKGRQKTRAKQIAAAEALEVLMKDIPASEFTKPGTSKLKERKAAGRGAGSRAERGFERGGDHNSRRDDRRSGGRHDRDDRMNQNGGYRERYGGDNDRGYGMRYPPGSYEPPQETYAERLERIQGRGYAMKYLASAAPPPVPPPVVYSMDDRVQVISMKRPYPHGDVDPSYMDPRNYSRPRLEATSVSHQPMVVEPSSVQSYVGAYNTPPPYVPLPQSAHQSAPSPMQLPQGTPSTFAKGPTESQTTGYAPSYGPTYAATSYDYTSHHQPPPSEAYGAGPPANAAYQAHNPAPYSTTVGMLQPQAQPPGSYVPGTGY